jgi:uncharacterized membrane protein (UPF0127 family)
VKLVHAATKQTLIPRLEVAASMWPRMRGLLGRDGLAGDEALWIQRCGSVHTFFMKFPIDLIFLDREMVVTKTFAKVVPFRLIWPGFRADSVVELQAGFLEKNPVRVGDKLHVDS